MLLCTGTSNELSISDEEGKKKNTLGFLMLGKNKLSNLGVVLNFNSRAKKEKAVERAKDQGKLNQSMSIAEANKTCFCIPEYMSKCYFNYSTLNKLPRSLHCDYNKRLSTLSPV